MTRAHAIPQLHASMHTYIHAWLAPQVCLSRNTNPDVHAWLAPQVFLSRNTNPDIHAWCAPHVCLSRNTNPDIHAWCAPHVCLSRNTNPDVFPWSSTTGSSGACLTSRVWKGSLTRFQKPATPKRVTPEKYGCDLLMRLGACAQPCKRYMGQRQRMQSSAQSCRGDQSAAGSDMSA
eukprot:358180-Chlamydomonas_euryale.AAC.3